MGQYVQWINFRHSHERRACDIDFLSRKIYKTLFGVWNELHLSLSSPPNPQYVRTTYAQPLHFVTSALLASLSAANMHGKELTYVHTVLWISVIRSYWFYTYLQKGDGTNPVTVVHVHAVLTWLSFLSPAPDSNSFFAFLLLPSPMEASHDTQARTKDGLGGLRLARTYLAVPRPGDLLTERGTQSLRMFCPNAEIALGTLDSALLPRKALLHWWDKTFVNIRPFLEINARFASYVPQWYMGLNHLIGDFSPLCVVIDLRAVLCTIQ